MATIVTVPGTNGSTISLSYDSKTNAALAQRIADSIKQGVDNNTIFQADNKDGPPPPVPAGKTGEYIQSLSASTTLPPSYKDVVNDAKTGAIFGSGDPGEGVLSGAKCPSGNKLSLWSRLAKGACTARIDCDAVRGTALRGA